MNSAYRLGLIHGLSGGSNALVKTAVGRLGLFPRLWKLLGGKAGAPRAARRPAAAAAATRAAGKLKGRQIPGKARAALVKKKREKEFKQVELPVGVPEKGPMFPYLMGRLGQAVSSGMYHLDPGLQRAVIHMAGGARDPLTARRIGFGTAGLGLGTLLALGGDEEEEAVPYGPMSGYAPPGLGNYP